MTGEQGVLIPESNVKDLMLRKDVVEAVKKDDERDKLLRLEVLELVNHFKLTFKNLLANNDYQSSLPYNLYSEERIR